MPGSFIDQRERSNEELKSKGRIERERQWGSKVKGSSVLQNISKGMVSLWKGCVNLFYSQVGRDKLFSELNKGTLVYSQAEGQGPPGKPLSMIIIIKASQRNSFQHGVRIGFLPATQPLTRGCWNLPKTDTPRPRQRRSRHRRLEGRSDEKIQLHTYRKAWRAAAVGS